MLIVVKYRTGRKVGLLTVSTDLAGGKGSLFGSGACVAPDGLHGEAALASRWRYYENAMTIIVTLSGAPPETTWSRS